MFARRSSPRSDAAIDRLGRCVGASEFRSMAPMRHSVSLAITPLHGDCLDIPRRLQPRRLSRIANGREAVCICQLDDCPAASYSYPANPIPGIFRTRARDLHFRSSIRGVCLSLSRVRPRSAKVESKCKTIATCIGRISPGSIRSVNYKE